MKSFSLFLIALLSAAPVLGADNLPDLGTVPDAASETAASPTKTPGPVADPAEAAKAQTALQDLIHAYEMGDVTYIRNRLSPSMIGYQRFVDGLVQDVNRMKQMRIHLFDTQVTAGPDVSVIQTGWEKRFLSVTTTTPELYSGHSMILLHRENNEWKISALAGDNLFASQSGVLGQLTATPAIIAVCPCPFLTVTLVDPDLAGAPSVTVEITTPQGEHEVLTLLALGSAGRYTGTMPTDIGGGFVINNNVLEVNGLAGLPVYATIRYLDQNPGGNRPPSVVSTRVRFGP